MTDCAYRTEVVRHLADPTAPVPDELARHLDACRTCRALFDGGRLELERASFGALSASLRERMLDVLAGERMRTSRRLVRRRSLAMLAAAAVVSVLAAAAWYLVALGSNVTGTLRAEGTSVAVALVEDHIRYLGHADRSKDAPRDELEADLQDHVDFPVSLPDLPGARLTGARRCFLLGRRAALAFYDTADGPASFFAMAGDGLEVPGRACSGGTSPSCAAYQGHHLVAWRDAGLMLALVGSDEQRLVELARTVWSPTSRPDSD